MNENDNKNGSWFSGIIAELIVILVTLVLFFLLLPRIQDTMFVGYADPAAYGEVASNILSGRGPVQDFIDFYFTRHSTISHLTEHWFSLFTLVLMPSLALMGKTAFAVKLPVLLFYVFLPLLTFLLVDRLWDKRAALFAALSIAVSPLVLEYAITGWPDIPFTVLAVISILCYIKAADRPQWYCLTGFILGLLTWFRASGVLIIVALILVMLLKRRGDLKKSLFPWISPVFMILGFLPSVLLSFHYFGEPFHGSHMTLSATMGYAGNPQEEHWQISWDHPPSLKDRLKEEGIVPILKKTGRELTSLVRQRNYFEENPPLLLMVTVPLIILALWILTVERKLFSSSLAVILLLCYLGGIALLFKMNSRYLFITQVMLLGAGWHGLFAFLDWLEATLKNEDVKNLWHKWTLGYITASIVFIGLFGLPFLEFYARFDKSSERYPFTDDYATLAAFKQVTTQVPQGEAVMCTLPWSCTFHTGRKTVMIPYGTVRDMLTISSHYSVSHLADFSGQGTLFLSEYPEFQPYARSGKSVLYQIKGDNVDNGDLFYQRKNWSLFEWK